MIGLTPDVTRQRRERHVVVWRRTHSSIRIWPVVHFQWAQLNVAFFGWLIITWWENVIWFLLTSNGSCKMVCSIIKIWNTQAILSIKKKKWLAAHSQSENIIGGKENCRNLRDFIEHVYRDECTLMSKRNVLNSSVHKFVSAHRWRARRRGWRRCCTRRQHTATGGCSASLNIRGGVWLPWSSRSDSRFRVWRTAVLEDGKTRI